MIVDMAPMTPPVYQTIDGAEVYASDLADGAIATGDLFGPFAVHDAQYAGVVLTPMCDLAQEKIAWVKLAVAYPFTQYLEQSFLPAKLKTFNEYRGVRDDIAAVAREFLNNPQARQDAVTLRLVRDMQQIIENVRTLSDAHYFLPGMDDKTGAFLVDLSRVFSTPYRDFAGRQPQRRLRSPWREQLLNRYVALSMRVGTKDYSKEFVCETICAFFPELSAQTVFGKLT